MCTRARAMFTQAHARTRAHALAHHYTVCVLGRRPTDAATYWGHRRAERRSRGRRASGRPNLRPSPPRWLPDGTRGLCRKQVPAALGLTRGVCQVQGHPWQVGCWRVAGSIAQLVPSARMCSFRHQCYKSYIMYMPGFNLVPHRTLGVYSRPC